MADSNNKILWESYFYPGTDVFINHFGEKDYEKLKELEATYSFNRLLELRENSLHLGCGKEHLNAVHKYIFGDVYPFAGEYRKVNVQKERGYFFFAHKPEDFDQYLDELFQDMNEELMYCHDKLDFCGVLGTLYTKLIYCHPYREGNGRAIREFLREYTLEKSKEIGIGEWELDWSKVNRDELNRYLEVSHIFPKQTALLFLGALTSPENSDNKKITS